jgi:hypothetical protein
MSVRRFRKVRVAREAGPEEVPVAVAPVVVEA